MLFPYCTHCADNGVPYAPLAHRLDIIVAITTPVLLWKISFAACHWSYQSTSGEQYMNKTSLDMFDYA